MIDASTSFLRLYATEIPSECRVTFSAYFGAHTIRDPVRAGKHDKIEIVHTVPDFVESDDVDDVAFRLIAIDFQCCRLAHLSIAYADDQVVNRRLFDWSATRERFTDEPIQTYLQRFADEWCANRICPDSRMYAVHDSLLLKQFREDHFTNDQTAHYLLLGHDAYIDVIADGWTWSKGQPLPF